MYDVLAAVEAELPELLEQTDWNSLHVTYEPPEVRRLWRQWGVYRIFLHELFPCEPNQALYHPHPWPSIVKIVDAWGQYQMGIGFGEGLVPPPIAMTTWLKRGCVYEMTQRDAWHLVAPTAPVLSLMVTGVPWGREMPRSDHPPQGPLSAELATSLRRKFVRCYLRSEEEWTPALAQLLTQMKVEKVRYRVEDRRGDNAPFVTTSEAINIAQIEQWLADWRRVKIWINGSSEPRFILRGSAGIPID